jgi:hypothetical protein
MLVMAKDKQRPSRKPSQGTDRHTQPRKAFHAPQELFDAIQAFIESAPRPKPTESECFRAAVEEFLEKRGFWPPKEK